LADAEFREGHLSTSFIDRFFRRRKKTDVEPEAEAAAALVLALESKGSENPLLMNVSTCISTWLDSGREDILR